MTKTPRIAIVDYQMSNLFSVQRACDFVGLRAALTSDPAELLKADGVILPGVGAFGAAMENLRRLELLEAFPEFVQSGKPLFGICLGMQLLFTESEEFGQHRGLGLVAGKVVKFSKRNELGVAVKVPQIGWNRILNPDAGPAWRHSALKSVAGGEFMYFVHSFYCVPQHSGDVCAYTDYESIRYCSAVARENIFAAQFHPEKSAKAGLKIYMNWRELF